MRSPYSILMTLYDREYEVILSTLRSLRRSLWEDDELIIVNDGSSLDYTGVKAYCQHFPRSTWYDLEPYDAFRIGGFNNPARAFNKALELATEDRLFVMSSDVLVTPNAYNRAARVDFKEMAWTPLVIDLENSFNLPHYCGPMRLFPAPWFLGCYRKHVIDCGGWDENYLDGMCYEDNDFIGRLMLQTGRFIGDWNATVYHQSHTQPAYKVEDPDIKEANKRNYEYTKKKWDGGIPFAGHEEAVFDVLRKPYVTGDIVHECKYGGTLLADVISRTKSPFVKVVP